MIIQKLSDTTYTTEGYTIHINDPLNGSYVLTQNKDDLQINKIPSLQDMIEISKLMGYDLMTDIQNKIDQSIGSAVSGLQSQINSLNSSNTDLQNQINDLKNRLDSLRIITGNWADKAIDQVNQIHLDPENNNVYFVNANDEVYSAGISYHSHL